MHRGGCVGVLGLRIVVQDVAASLGLAVAAAAMRLVFDVAASLGLAVAAAAIKFDTIRGVSFPGSDHASGHPLGA